MITQRREYYLSRPISYLDFDANSSNGPKLDEPPQREPVRGALAFGLIGLFVIEIVFGMAYTLRANADMIVLKDLFTIILTPTVALLGVALTFYYQPHRPE